MTVSTAPDIAIVALAAGKGTRMRSRAPKVLHEIGARPLLHHALSAGLALAPARCVVVTGDHAPEVGDAAKALVPDCAVAVQAPPQGTGDAVKCALPALDGFSGVVVVLYADTPLIRTETLARLVTLCSDGAAVGVLGFESDDPGAYGRLIVDGAGRLEAIVEARDASDEQLRVRLCNSGVMAFRSDVLFELLPKIGNDNAKGEYYLTDMVALARAAGHDCAHAQGDEQEFLGVNSRVELAAADALFQARMRDAAMEAGATLVAPETVYFSFDTELGRDVIVHPNVVFGPGVQVADDVEVKSFCHLERARVRAGAAVGPYARLRPDADIGEGARIGNFVEIKKATLGAGAKVSHLSYVGDAVVGAGANIGAGVITCNYDGYDKFTTEIGENAFIGSNSVLIAPVKIADDAFVGAASAIGKDVESGALAITRAPLQQIKGWVRKFRARKESSNKR